MNTPETKDKLKNMFQEIKTEDTSADFMKHVMLRVEKEVSYKKKRKYFISCLAITLGIAGIFLIPTLIIDILGLNTISVEFPNIFLGIQSIFENFNIDPKIAGLGLIILLLLLGDSILRKAALHKKGVI